MKIADKGAVEKFDASNCRVGVVVASFNKNITDQILEKALAELKDYQVPESNSEIYRVAGSVEIPTVLQALAQTKKYDCLIAIGAIVRGETDHYDYVAKLVTEGVLRVMLDNTIPVGFAVLTTDNEGLAQARVEIGAEAVRAALHSQQAIVNL